MDKKQSLVLPIITIVFAIVGMLSLGIVFIPIAFICVVISTFISIKCKQIGYIGLTVLGWVLTVIGLFLSPVLLAAIGLVSAE